jgi:hypothetical protein
MVRGWFNGVTNDGLRIWRQIMAERNQHNLAARARRDAGHKKTPFPEGKQRFVRSRIRK